MGNYFFHSIAFHSFIHPFIEKLFERISSVSSTALIMELQRLIVPILHELLVLWERYRIWELLCITKTVTERSRHEQGDSVPKLREEATCKGWVLKEGMPELKHEEVRVCKKTKYLMYFAPTSYFQKTLWSPWYYCLSSNIATRLKCSYMDKAKSISK